MDAHPRLFLLLAGSASSALFHIAAIYSGRPGVLAGATVTPLSDLRLLGDLQGIIDLDAKVPHRRLQHGVPKEQLYRARRRSPPQVGAVGF